MHLFHKWSKWEDVKIVTGGPFGNQSTSGQRRRCATCGRKQVRKV